MKELGMVRKLDQLGRVTLPMELRRTLGIKEGDPVEIYVEGKTICIRACKLQCVFCVASEDEKKLIEKNSVHVCTQCADELGEEAMDQ